MTALAFILGVVPLVIATGAGSEMRQVALTAHQIERTSLIADGRLALCPVGNDRGHPVTLCEAERHAVEPNRIMAEDVVHLLGVRLAYEVVTRRIEVVDVENVAFAPEHRDLDRALVGLDLVCRNRTRRRYQAVYGPFLDGDCLSRRERRPRLARRADLERVELRT